MPTMTAEQYQRAAERSEINYRLDCLESDVRDCKTLAARILAHLVREDDSVSDRANVMALQSTSARAIATGAGTSALLLADRYDLN